MPHMHVRRQARADGPLRSRRCALSSTDATSCRMPQLHPRDAVLAPGRRRLCESLRIAHLPASAAARAPLACAPRSPWGPWLMTQTTPSAARPTGATPSPPAAGPRLNLALKAAREVCAYYHCNTTQIPTSSNTWILYGNKTKNKYRYRIRVRCSVSKGDGAPGIGSPRNLSPHATDRRVCTPGKTLLNA